MNDKIKSYISSFFYSNIITDYNIIDLEKNENLKFISNSLQKDISKISEEIFKIDIEINEVSILNYNQNIFYILDNGKVIISIKTLEDLLENKKLFLIMTSLELSSILLNNYYYDKTVIDSLYYNIRMISGYSNNSIDQYFINKVKKIYFSRLNKVKLNESLMLLETKLNLGKLEILENLKNSKYFDFEDKLDFLTFSNRYKNIFE